MDFKNFYDELLFDIDQPVIKSLKGKQGDTKSRGLYVKVMQKNAIVNDLTGLSMRLFYEKPDGTRGFIDGVVENNQFRIDFTNQIYAVPGVVKAELRLSGSNGEVISLKTFKILVESSIADGSIVSQDERGILDRAFELAEDIIPRIELLDIELLENVQSLVQNMQNEVQNMQNEVQNIQNEVQNIQNEQAQDRVTIAQIQQEFNAYKAIMSQINVNQEAKQQASGHGIVSLPQSAAEGQVSVTVKGNTETDEEGTKSTLCAFRIRSVSEDESQESVVYVLAKDDEENIEELRSLPNGTKDEINVTEGKYIQRVGVDETDPGNPTFTRSSVAHKSDGTQVAANQPRFEPGKFGKAIMVEEGTTNLLGTYGRLITDSNSDGVADGFNSGSDSTITAVKTVSPDYGQKLEITASSSANSGTWITFSSEPSISAGEYLTISAIVSISGSVYGLIHLLWRDVNGVVVGTSSFNWNSSNIVNGKIQKTFTAPANTAKVTIGFHTRVSVAGGTGYITYKDVNVEKKPYATSFIDGTRADETLIIPTAGVLRKGKWIKEIVFIPTSPQNVVGKIGYLWECFINDDNYYALKVGADGKPYLEVKSNGIIYQTSTALAPVLAVGSPYRFAVRGNGSLMALFVNGNKISEVSYVEPVGDLPANMFIGSDHNGANHANGLYDDLRISSIARSNEEILAAYQSGQPLPVDECTSYKLGFDDNLNKERATTLIYQLAQEQIIPVQVSGVLVGYPNGTVFFEKIVADAGVYTDKIEILYQQLPIKRIEKVSKVDYQTGLEYELDPSQAVISPDGLSFTHPGLSNGDIVFFIYEYSTESTEPEITVSYYNNRYVVQGPNGKFYKWFIEVKEIDGQMKGEIKLVEVV